jgi:hypothetical protein
MPCKLSSSSCKAPSLKSSFSTGSGTQGGMMKKACKKYKVIRAPTLLLLDAAGEIILRQDNVVRDDEPLGWGGKPLFAAFAYS